MTNLVEEIENMQICDVGKPWGPTRAAWELQNLYDTPSTREFLARENPGEVFILKPLPPELDEALSVNTKKERRQLMFKVVKGANGPDGNGKGTTSSPSKNPGPSTNVKQAK